MRPQRVKRTYRFWPGWCTSCCHGKDNDSLIEFRVGMFDGKDIADLSKGDHYFVAIKKSVDVFMR